MSVIAITSFSTSTPVDKLLHTIIQALKSSHTNTPFVIGTRVQSPSTIQITSSWPSTHHPTTLHSSPAFQAFQHTIRTTSSSQPTTITALLDSSPFASGTPPLVEFVHTSFPAADVTPEVQHRTESDFAKFEAIYRRRGTMQDTGEVGLATGWTEEHDGVRGFLVVRGWVGMQRFEEAVGTEVWKEGIPILLAWGKPFDLWHVERRGGGEGA